NQMVRKRNRGYSQKVGLDDLLRQPLQSVEKVGRQEKVHEECELFLFFFSSYTVPIHQFVDLNQDMVRIIHGFISLTILLNL
ncbi:hypothetical protein, partial [Parageobacillus thermoglucosidasius]|uniref:hypothetical protein n=1 Tax=Parageobacillus thermoglucosidasius TaxID=1426 RepID=UPI001C8969D0